MNAKQRLKMWMKAKVSSGLRRTLGPRCKGVLFDSDNGLLLLPPTDLSISRTLSKEGVYNRPMLGYLASIVSPQTHILFVGTHVGAILIPSAKRAASVVGIEANPETFALLQKNLALNGVTNAEIFNVAAYESDTTLEFAAARENTGGSKILNGTARRFEFFYDKPSIIRVPARRLDDLLADRRFDLIVMDIEGGEVRALRGMPKLLSAASRLVLEVLPNHLEHVANVTPEEFFAAVPERFAIAKPLDAPELEPSYPRARFLEMYREILARRRFNGVDVVFEVPA